MMQRKVRVAAIGDLHFDQRSRGGLSELFDHVNREADVLALVGDLTTHGEPEQMKSFLDELAGVQLPVVAVLGNHDYETGHEDELCAMLADAEVAVLDGTAVELEGIGFTGVKGFAGGFGRAALGPFGESLIKEFVQHAVDEALKLERGLHELKAERRVVLTHYAPIVDTLIGEPEQIYAYLGSSRLLAPIETLGADVVLHGHAHHGSYRGTTPSGIPVFNVCRHVVESQGLRFHVEELPVPDRREREPSEAAG